MQRRNGPTPQVLAMLGLLSLVATAFVASFVILATKAPPHVALAVGLVLLCIDTVSIAMVWYVTGRR